jgi:hypothetical protein
LEIVGTLIEGMGLLRIASGAGPTFVPPYGPAPESKESTTVDPSYFGLLTSLKVGLPEPS